MRPQQLEGLRRTFRTGLWKAGVDDPAAVSSVDEDLFEGALPDSLELEDLSLRNDLLDNRRRSWRKEGMTMEWYGEDERSVQKKRMRCLQRAQWQKLTKRVRAKVGREDDVLPDLSRVEGEVEPWQLAMSGGGGEKEVGARPMTLGTTVHMVRWDLLRLFLDTTGEELDFYSAYSSIYGDDEDRLIRSTLLYTVE
ncbi:hypothetical protein MRB53_040384 [Persea americana]|nr:hypothetical protein MRB53_040384 [Persea americana]